LSVLGWRQWAVDKDGLLRPAWRPWSPYPPRLVLWRPDGITRAHCLRDGDHSPAPAGERAGAAGPPGEGVAPGAAGPHAGAGLAGEPGAPQAADAGDGFIPHPRCACGLYAWSDPATLAAAPYPRWTRRPIVVGVVRLGGRMIIGERGVRASSGYPVAVLDRDGVVSPAYQVARYREWAPLVAEWHATRDSSAS
jgi:hypothetical protein